MKTFTATSFILFVTLVVTAVAFPGSKAGREVTPNKPAVSEEIMNRRAAFATGVSAALLVAAPSIAFAAKPAEKTCECEEKQNKSACLDLCLYECVKHGGSSDECAIDCVRQCKTVKGQRTMATPITQKGVDYK
jgi:hypothetical protein